MVGAVVFRALSVVLMSQTDYSKLVLGLFIVVLVVAFPRGIVGSLQAPAVKEVAARLGLPVEQPVRVKDPALAERLAALAPDVFVVAAYGRILPPALLAVPRLGPWNIHASIMR